MAMNIRGLRKSFGLGKSSNTPFYQFNEKDLDRVLKNMSTLSRKISTSILNKASLFAMKPIEKKIKSATPIDTGLLKKASAITQKKSKYRKRANSKPAFVWAGFDTAFQGPTGEHPAKYAHLVEGGTTEHKIKLEKTARINFSGQFRFIQKGTTIHHAGAKKREFAKKVYQSSKSSVIDRFVRKATTEFNKLQFKET